MDINRVFWRRSSGGSVASMETTDSQKGLGRRYFITHEKMLKKRWGNIIDSGVICQTLSEFSSPLISLKVSFCKCGWDSSNYMSFCTLNLHLKQKWLMKGKKKRWLRNCTFQSSRFQIGEKCSHVRSTQVQLRWGAGKIMIQMYKYPILYMYVYIEYILDKSKSFDTLVYNY